MKAVKEILFSKLILILYAGAHYHLRKYMPKGMLIRLLNINQNVTTLHWMETGQMFQSLGMAEPVSSYRP